MERVLTLILVAALATSSCGDSERIDGLHNESLEQRRELEALTKDLDALRGALEVEQGEVAWLRKRLDMSHHRVGRAAGLSTPCWMHEAAGYGPMPEWCSEILELDHRIDELERKIDRVIDYLR